MRIFLIAALALLAVQAQAQQKRAAPPPEVEDDVQSDDDVSPDETEANVVPDEGDHVRMQRSGPAHVHIVIPGDTLWDLSQQYLGSPWYWPKVWSYNPEIANPHWIYPGNRVRFLPSGEEVPMQVETGEIAAEPSTGLTDESGVQATGKIGYTPSGTHRLLLQGFITARELEQAGEIAGSFAETLMLSYPDSVYVRFRNRGAVRPGGEYVIFKTIKRVDHPSKGGTAGYLTHFLGKAKVVAIGPDVVTAQITDTWDEIHRGDLIGPANEDLRLKVAQRPNDRTLDGVVLEMLVPYLTMVGEHQLVLVDRGSGDGVQVGNTFTVVRRQDLGGTLMDPKGGQDKRWPEESIATCMVVDVKDRACTCLMTRSIREVVRGDRVVMKAGQGASASR
ncbi:MAG TPA: LysM domain-containing protein [Myxococcaceae bacterium]|nr:LysM domain-containing protein [Myxococcaceae bacterium]